MSSQKFIHEFKRGDIVHWYGADFEVTEDARESQSHRPQAAHLVTAQGPCDVAVAPSVCIGGSETQGYIMHGRPWTFQGNHLAGTYLVDTKH